MCIHKKYVKTIWESLSYKCYKQWEYINYAGKSITHFPNEHSALYNASHSDGIHVWTIKHLPKTTLSTLSGLKV